MANKQKFSEWACLEWKILADIRRVFLAYLEAPNSILVKNRKINRILLNCPPITPSSPRWANGCLGSLGLLL